MAEVVVVHGYAGSGKTTQCERVVEERPTGISVRHISVGSRLRAIRTHAVTSRYSGYINSPDAPKPLPDEIVNSVIFESVEETPEHGLILIDGYPRHSTAVDLFYDSLQANHHTLLGTIALQIAEGTSVERILARGLREGEKLKGSDLVEHALNRYERDTEFISMAIEELGRIALVERIEAEHDEDEVYFRFTAALGRLALQKHFLA